MRYLVFVSCVITLHLTGCGIGGVWLEPSNRPLRPSYPFGARWVKEGMTRESRKADWVACGGGENLSDGFRKWIQPEPWETFWPMKDAHSKQLSSCMQSKGYDYRNPSLPGLPDECNAQTCLYP